MSSWFSSYKQHKKENRSVEENVSLWEENIELKNKVRKLESTIKELTDKPVQDEVFYFITSTLNIDERTYNNSVQLYRDLYSVGNFFRTMDAAIIRRNQIAHISKMKWD